MKEYKPKLVRDFKIYEDKTLFLNKPIYFIGSKEVDRTLKVNPNKIDFIRHIINIIDGSKTIMEIEKDVKNKGHNIEIELFLELLSKNGLMEGSIAVSNSEVDLLSKTIIDIPINLKSEKQYNKLRYFNIINYCFIIMALIFIGMNFNYFKSVELNRNFIIYMLPLTFITIILHELGHLFYAIANNITIHRIRLSLMFGLVPMVYIKYKNLYFISSKKRLALILSGVLANVELALIGCIYYFYTQSNIAASIIYLNIGFIIGNLYPHQITDGYFALCTIFNKYNLRLEAIYYIFNIKRKNKELKTMITVITYLILMIISLSAAAIMIYNIFTQITKIDIDKYYWYIIIGIFIFMLIRLHIQVKHLRKNISLK